VKPLAEVDAELVAAMKEYVEAYATHLPVRRVAVVGNAPLKPSRERQELIDGSDLVFRCNSFVLDEPGDEPCLGTKTDVVVAARGARPTPWFFKDYTRRAYLVIDAGSVRRAVPAPMPESWPEDLGAWFIPNRTFGIPLKIFMKPDERGAGAVPTTGTESAYVAHELFPEAQLLLTGFSFLEDREQQRWEHHWGSEAPVHHAHILDREGELLQSWVDDGSAVSVP
jgi:hypothetical protein